MKLSIGGWKVNKNMGKTCETEWKWSENKRTLTLSSGFNFFLKIAFLAILALRSSPADEIHAGPFYDRYPTPDEKGKRTEILGPLFGWETRDSASLFRFSPVFSLYRDSTIPQTEFELAYPILSFDKFGKEY